MDSGSHYNYYEILEVSPHCSQPEITKAYERSKATYSGDNPAVYTIFSPVEAREFLALIEEAYSVLKNKTLRSLYDEKLGQGIKSTQLSFQSLSTENIHFQKELHAKSAIVKLDYKIDDDIEKDIQKTMDWDGTKLKQVREYKNVSIEKMSEITKVSGYYIHSIENLDYANLPAPVFVRGYLVQICKVLGLNEKVICDSYMKKFKALSIEKK